MNTEEFEKRVEEAYQSGEYADYLNGEQSEGWAKEAIRDVIKSGLTPETLRKAGVEVCQFKDSHEIKKALNLKTLSFANELWSTNRLVAYPYPDREDHPEFDNGLVRYKLLKTVVDENGKKTKYLQPKGTGGRIYVQPEVAAVKNKVHISVWVSEGEKKTQKLIQHGELCIGLSGVNITDGIWEFKWKSREVFIAFDSDLHVKPQVRLALYDLAFGLYASGANVKIVHWDTSEGKGIDDYLVSKSSVSDAIYGLKSNAIYLMDFIRPEHKYEVENALAKNDLGSRHDEIIGRVAKQIGTDIKSLKRTIKDKRIEITKALFNGKRDDLEFQLREYLGIKELINFPAGYTVEFNGFDRSSAHPIQSELMKLIETNDGVIPIPLSEPFIVAAYIDTPTGRKQLLKGFQGKELLVDLALSDIRTFDKEVGANFIGVTLTRDKIRYLIEYVHDYQMANKERIQRLLGLISTGWVGDTFYLPSRSYRNIRWMNDKITSALKTKGDKAEQIKIISYLLTTRASIVILLGLAAPLFKKFGIRNVTLHLAGLQHGGKTCSESVAMSMYGDPLKLTGSWDSTKVGREIYTSMFNDMPVFFDEWERVGNVNQIIDFIYGYEGGTGKIRGNKQLTLQDDRSYRGVLFTSGEKDLDSILYGIKKFRTVPRGAHRRAIEINVDDRFIAPLNYANGLEQDKLKGLLSNLYETSENHYGWLGIEWTQHIEDKENLRELETLYKNWLSVIDSTGGLDKVFAVVLAVLHSSFGRQFVSETYAPLVEKYILQLADEQKARNTQVRDIATEFYDALRDYCDMNANHIMGMSNDQHSGTYGAVIKDDVFLLSTTLDNFCKDNGFVKKQVLAELDKAGKLKKTSVGKGNTYTCKQQLNYRRQNGYYFIEVFNIEEDESEKQPSKVVPLVRRG